MSTALDCIEYMIDTAIAGGTDIGSRIYLKQAPQPAVFPLAVLDIISRVESPTQDSGSAVDTYRVQVDILTKNGSTSGFKQADDIASDLRLIWSRVTDGTTYTNHINGVQEEGYRTDFDSQLGVFTISSDYLIRVIDPLAGLPVQPASPTFSGNYSTSEQLWPYSKWLGSIPIYWRTFSLSTGADDYETLTGLSTSIVSVITDTEVRGKLTSSGEWQIIGAEIIPNGSGGYKIFTSSAYEQIHVTVYYTKQ